MSATEGRALRDRQQSRPTVVLLPGLLCDAAVWQQQRLALPQADCIVADYGAQDALTAMALEQPEAVSAPLHRWMEN